MHARNRTWLLGSDPVERCRQRTLPVEGGDGSTLTLDFTTMSTTADLTARGLSFTRGSGTNIVGGVTYIGSDGLVKYAGTNEPRFDHDPTTRAPRGLLLEGNSANLLVQSGDWNTTWNNPAQITWNGTTYTTAPDGTNTAKQITVTAGSSSAIGQAVATGTNRTISVWLKAGSLTSFSIGAFDAGGTAWGNNADSTCSKISGPGSVTQQVGGLWSITGLSTTEWTRIQIFRSTTYTTFLAYPGSSSGTINGTAFMWGMQMEAGNGASSLIPTGASTATRVQDQMEMADISALSYNLSVGTVALTAFWNKNASSAFPRSIRFVDASNVISSAIITTTDDLLGNWPLANGTTTLETTSANVPPVARFKYAMSASAVANPTLATLAVALNGTTGSVTGVASTVRPATKLQFLYGAGAATDYPSMTISSLKYWPTLMTSAQLQAMTTL